MKKKVLSLILCSAMVVASLAGCGKDTGKDTEASASASVSTETKVEAAAVPQDYTYYYSFDAKDDKASIQPTSQTIGGDPILSAIDKDKKYIPGVKGDSLYVDGVTGYKLTDVNGVGDTYTVAFWLYPTRFANYMPTVQFGPDVHGDATGGQKYVNITRAEWSGSGTFPCVWSYDQLDGALWPNWADANTGELMKQWIHIALVVDPSNISVDGRYIYAKLYINGKEWIAKDSDGNVNYPGVVKGAMSASDNFDFLVGVNYWDSVFKGAFDELYIYNYALDAAQVAGLYADGNSSVAYEEPARVIDVKANDKAIASIGALDFSKDDDVYDQVTSLADGHTVQVKLKHWSDGKDSKDNYYFSFINAEGAEVARLNADMTGSVNGTAMPDSAFIYSWGNWNTWTKSVMVETEVTAKLTRNGDEITVEIDNVDYNKSSNTCKAVFTVSDVAAFKLGTTKSYTDILQVKDVTPAAGGITVGNTDRTTGWWTAFSNIFAIPEGKSVTKTFKNFTSGEQMWHNFVVILQNTESGHSTDTEGYAEYAVVRADNFGWGDGYATATLEHDWNDAEFLADMDGATCDVTITNNGSTADVEIEFTSEAGKVFHQSYKGITITGPLYACFSCEGSYLTFDTVTVGATDKSAGWWSTFSNIWKVNEGESKTVYFKNYSDCVNNWDNFVAILQNVPGGHSADAYEGYAEYAVVRADNFGWGEGYATATLETDCDWTQPTAKDEFDGAYIELTVTNNGSTADVVYTATTEAGKVYHQSYKGITITGDLYFCLGLEKAYLQIECVNVGATDKSAGWWTTFSDIKKVEEGKSVATTFVNYSDAVNNWDNFVVILQTTPTGHSGDTEGYAEYAVVRADNFGWGDGYTTATLETNCDWTSATAKDEFDGANIYLEVTNNGSTADVVFTATTAAGKVYTQKYLGITITGDLYYCLGLEKAYLAID